jgi:large subunit ribosomal protein L20
MRITRSVTRKARKKKIMKFAEGFINRRKNCYQIAVDKIYKKLQYQHRDRRNIKRDMRRLWITRINAGLKLLGYKYSEFIHKLNLNPTINLNRKSLSELASRDIANFNSVVTQVMNT